MSIDDRTAVQTDGSELRDRAVKRLKKRRDFYGHVLVYVLVNGFLTVLWLVTDRRGFFWPVFPMAGWGIAVILNAWDVIRPEEFDERRIQREMSRLRRRKAAGRGLLVAAGTGGVSAAWRVPRRSAR